jgi:CRP/FNR family transcriptional regulator, cyclic AMP receptor protein
MPADAPTVGTVERILSLKRIPILSGLPPEDLAVVAEHGRERFFPKGGVLLREGEPIPALYAVLDGRVHMSRKGRVLGHVGSAGFVGGAGMFARDPDGLAAVAETDTLALEVEADAALEIFEDHFPILHHVLREVCRWLLDLVARLPSERYPDIFPPFEVPRAPTGDLDLVERILFLRQVSPFTRSSINALAELSRGMAEVAFPPGTRLWDEGEAAGTVLLIVSGTVGCTARGGDAVFTTRPGAPMGAVESMAERPRWYTATTETKVTALQGSVEGLIDVFEDNFEMAMDYLAVMARAQIRLLELRVSASGAALERVYGCADAPDDPT